MKKIVASLVLFFVATFSFVSCSGSRKAVSKEDIKIGLITLHDENSTYDKNFIDSMKKAVKELGLRDDQLEIKSGIEEDNSCYDEASRLAKKCNVIFADSFGHEDYLIQAAKENPSVLFAHATGTKAHTEKLDNFGNAFAAIYEGRYLAGIAAGMKLNELIEDGYITEDEAKVGYVGAFPYAEVKSGYTSFFLGVQSVCPTATMEVQFTNSWFNLSKEETVAQNLIRRGCVLISQHADSMGAPNACEAAGIPNVTYNGTTVASCPETYIVSSKIDWTPYFKYLINSAIAGTKIDYDWTGTIANGAVVLDPVGTNAASGTQEAIDQAKAKLEDGTLHVFDTSKFTVKGNHLTTYMADVDSDEKFTPDHEAISNGYFHESEMRSAPYFDIDIDGITNLGELRD